MNKRELFICTRTMSIIDAMSMIDANAKGILFVVNEKKQLIGSLTDGDIRRWLIKTGKLTSSVGEVMNSDPKWLFENLKDTVEIFMNENHITAVPILDERKHIVDIELLKEDSLTYKKRKKENLGDVPVVIMAGGKGTRLYPFTKILPKPLIPIGETPIIERIIDSFTGFGIEKFYISVNYKKGMIQSYFDELSHNYSIKYIEESKPLGTGGSIKLINDSLKKPLFIANCDSLILANYFDLYRYHLKSENDITLVSALKKFTIPYGILHSGKNGEIREIEEKPTLSFFVNTGMYIINPEVIEKIPENEFFHMTHLIDKVMKEGGRVGTYPISEDSFLDMGDFDEMKRMEEKLKNLGGE